MHEAASLLYKEELGIARLWVLDPLASGQCLTLQGSWAPKGNGNPLGLFGEKGSMDPRERVRDFPI